MLNLRNLALASACAWVAGATAFAPAALAEHSGKGTKNYDIYGGGASVPAPYARQTFDCYANPTDLIISGSPPQFEAIAAFDYTGNPPQNCATQHVVTNATIWLASASAGPGILSIFGHDPSFFGFINQQDNAYFPSVQYAFSTTSLGTTDVGVYNNGGTETQGKSSVTIAAPGALSCSGKQNNEYPNPLQCFGPLIQFPFAITPIVFAYNATYEKWVDSHGNETDYHFNVQFERNDNSGGLHLSPTTYCGIWNGEITNWNDPALKADNGGTPLYDPNDPAAGSNWSVPLQIVGRSDSSGATSIFTRHLANVCAAVSGNQYSTGSSTLPTTLQGPTYNVDNPNYPGVSGEQPGKFTLAPNNSGVAQYTAFTVVPSTSLPSNCSVTGAAACIQLGRITFSGTDYVLPYVADLQLNTYNLSTATLQNFSGQWEEGTPATAQAAYSVIQPPQSSKTGKYCATCTNFGLRSDPTAWVQSNSPSEPIANPTTSGAYPVVGTANWLVYTCYNSKYQEKTLTGVMKYISEEAINYDNKNGILAAAGLSPLDAQWRNAIKGTFVSNNDGLNLQIGVAGSGPVCSQSGIVGG